jgi:hypothetical protein
VTACLHEKPAGRFANGMRVVIRLRPAITVIFGPAVKPVQEAVSLVPENQLTGFVFADIKHSMELTDEPRVV